MLKNLLKDLICFIFEKINQNMIKTKATSEELLTKTNMP